jgi:tetratricopeptide (TPR) repeat protein
MKPDLLWAELKRRRVVRVAVAYAVVVFGVLQVADLTFGPLGIPDWTYRLLVFVSLAGFPVAVALAWAFDMTPDGVKADSEGEANAANAANAAGSGGSGGTTDAGGVHSGIGPMGQMVIGAATVLAIGVGVWQFAGEPDGVGADAVDNDVIAIIPFRVSSADDHVTILREGVVDLLAPILSGTPRTVDSGAMISAWRRYVEEEGADLSEGQAVELARRLGAGRVLVGSVVGSGESFTLNARLLRVPGGEIIGDATVDGSASGMREALSELGGRVLAMEAGVAERQIDYLAGVPIDALEDYLRGRQLYRHSAYAEAREAFFRALEVDTTFALAALGARESSQMGVDADRFRQSARANRLLAQSLDRLPPRDREFVELWLPTGERRNAVEVLRASGAEMVRRLPDKAEAWYVYGDQLFHDARRVGERDWLERSMDAFERAAALDPGLQVVQEHLLFERLFFGDTLGLGALATGLLETSGGSETGVLARATLAWVLGDSAHARILNESLDTLSFSATASVLFPVEAPNNTLPSGVADRAFDRMERTAVAETDRRQALDLRHRFLRSAGRVAEADDQLRLYESAFGAQPRMWVEAYLYWDGSAESAEAASADLERRTAGSDALEWELGGRDACALELWRLRRGEATTVETTVARLRAGADDPDPTHGQNALCALTLETMAAHLSGSAESDRLVERMVEVVDQGPPGGLMWPTLELAWILEERGDLAAAARIAGYIIGNDQQPFAASTVYREAGRLNELAGNPAEALREYRWALALIRDPDERLRARTDSVRVRVAALEAQLGSR